MGFRSLFMLTALMSAAACDGAVYETFKPDNAYCTVDDGVTNQGQDVPLLYMGNGVPQGRMYAELAAQMRLLTFPERQDIAMTPIGFAPEVKIDGGVDAGAYPIGSSYGVVQVVPSEPLSNRWYLLGAVTLPKGVEWWGGTRFYRAADGLTGVRFRVGPQPEVLSVRRLDVPDGYTDVRVTFSENVLAVSADQPWFEVRSLSDPALPVTPCTARSYGMPFNEAHAKCEWLPPSHILQVTVRASVSPDGSKSVAEAVYQLDPAALVRLPGGDRVLYIEPRID